MQWVRDASGDRLGGIEINLRVLGACIGPSVEEGAATVAQELGVEAAVLRDSPFVFVGPVEAVHEQMLQNREEFGVTYYTVSQRHAEHLAPLLPHVRNS